MTESVNQFKAEVNESRTQIQNLRNVIKENEKINDDLVESNKVELQEKNKQLIATMRENKGLKKDFESKQTLLDQAISHSQEQQTELEKYRGEGEKSGRCANFEFCRGQGNIFCGTKIHRKTSRCPFTKTNEIHNL